MVSNLALFYLATYLATFQKIGRFFPNHLVTLVTELGENEKKTFLTIKLGEKNCENLPRKVVFFFLSTVR
jgi:hypothetical protein